MFGASRMYHRAMKAMIDAGFEEMPTKAFCYASGFPKSVNISKSMEKKNYSQDLILKFKGYGSALKPAQEPIICGKKPLSSSSL